jgi:hypothetical protein
LRKKKEKEKMNRSRNIFSLGVLFGFVFFGLASNADAQRDRRDARDIGQRLESRVNSFDSSLRRELSITPLGRIEEERVKTDLQNLKRGIRNFNQNLQRNRETADEVSNILYSAANVNSFLDRFRFGSRVRSDWAAARNLLENLADNYQVSVSWNDNTTPYPNNSRYPNDYPQNNRSGAFNYGLTGTYQIDLARSENAREIAERAARNNNIGAAEREDLEGKLDAPEQIAIDARGRQVTIASSKAAPITITADGTTRTENVGGRTIRLRAALLGEELTVSSLGGETDYTVIFASIDGGRSLKITRRITTDYLRQTVFVDSIYNKTDSVARLGIDGGGYSDDNDGAYSSNDPNDYPNSNAPYPQTRPGRRGEYVVPNGTIITGTLENEIDTKVSQNNDRFRLTVNAPNEYRGAVIEGYLSGINRSGQVSGRSQITFNFERIRLQNGQTYDFAGYLQSVTDENGKNVRIDTEGTARGDSQTKETVKRGGIGAGIGAVIGAIAGGAKGAAIGAIIGAGAGAGSVIIEGRDDLRLRQGSTVTVQSSSPIR